MEDLPTEVVLRICGFSGHKDILELACSSRRMRDEVQALLHAEGARMMGPDMCIEHEHLGCLRHHISKGLDLSRMDYAVDWDIFGKPCTRGSLLHLAIYCDNLDALHMLLRHGADPNVRDTAGSTPLNTAVRYKRNSFARQLVFAGADIHAQNEKGVTALHYAAKRGTVEMTRTLLKLGANPNALDENNNTPLHVAANPEVALELIHGSADLNIINSWGQSARDCLTLDTVHDLEEEEIFNEDSHRVVQVNFDIQCL